MSHAARTQIVSILVILLSAGVPSTEALDGTPSWTLSTVHTAGYGEEIPTPALAFDHYGRPAVCWGANLLGSPGNNAAVFSQLSELGFWSHREVPLGDRQILRTALVYDRAERPITSWIDDRGFVDCAFDHGTRQGVSSPSIAPEHPILSLDMDIAGNLRGMLADPSSGQPSLHDISLNALHEFSSDHMTEFDFSFDSLHDATMTTDHLGLRYVSARVSLDGEQDALALAWEPSFPLAPDTPWPSTIFKTADAVLGMDIATNPATGRPALAYTTYDEASDTSTLWFAASNGVALEEEAVLTSIGASVYEDVSLAFDCSDGLPGLAIEERDGGSERLLFAYLDGAATWQTSVVDESISIETPIPAPRGPSLAFDDYGTRWPAIAYIDADGSLAVAFDPPVPEPGTAFLLIVGLSVWRPRGRFSQARLR